MFKSENLITLMPYGENVASFILEDASLGKIKIYVRDYNTTNLFAQITQNQADQIRINHPNQVEIRLFNIDYQENHKHILHHNQIMNWKSLWILKDHKEILKNHSDILKKNNLSLTERQSLYKMILGMSMDAYGYDPKLARNKATGENKGSIQFALEQRNLFLDSETIRDHITIATELFPEAKPKSK